MKNLSRNAGLSAGVLPGFAKLFNPIGAVAIEKDPRQDCPPLVEHPLAKFPLHCDDLFFFIIEVGDPGVIVFRFPGFKPDDSEFSIDLISGEG
jgi:hypothetical protein